MTDELRQHDEHDVTTDIPQPRQRVFLQQSFSERFLSVLWTVSRYTLFRFSPGFAHRWRVFLLNLFGAHIHGSARISPSVHIDFPWNLTVEPHVTICHEVIINCMGRVRIGERTRISQYAHICAGTHDYQRRDMGIVRCPITIGRQVWIAADAFVGPNVTIGDGCMLAARSSAFGDLPAGQICVGEPAEPRRQRFEHEGEYAASQVAAEQQV
jgi:putative colanic acid biosynthesis acetyltransferase WcaF